MRIERAVELSKRGRGQSDERSEKKTTKSMRIELFTSALPGTQARSDAPRRPYLFR